MFQDRNKKGADISALNGQKAELPFKSLTLINIGNDDVKYEYRKSQLDNQSNIPM